MERKAPRPIHVFASATNPDVTYEVRVSNPTESDPCGHLYCTCPSWRLQAMKPQAMVRSCHHVANHAAKLLRASDDDAVFTAIPDLHKSILAWQWKTSRIERADALRAFVARNAIRARIDGWQEHARWILAHGGTSARLKLEAVAALLAN